MNQHESQFITTLKSDLVKHQSKLAEARARYAANPSNEIAQEVSSCSMTVSLMESALKDAENASRV